MSQISYTIRKEAEEWTVVRNGEADGSFMTQEAAFETAAAHAGGDLRSGYGVSIEAAPPTDPAGAQPQGGEPRRGDGFSA